MVRSVVRKVRASIAAALTLHALAIVLMVAGVCCAVAGADIQWGRGVSLLVAAALLIPLSIIIGWE